MELGEDVLHDVAVENVDINFTSKEEAPSDLKWADGLGVAAVLQESEASAARGDVKGLLLPLPPSMPGPARASRAREEMRCDDVGDGTS
mmetsp:Transcript_22847/g.64211  ORF Transcript_22847/g.64211 Transcript_22847/m.64211 type:complete len:89 (-) Transcript_22847:34-300(-)